MLAKVCGWITRSNKALFDERYEVEAIDSEGEVFEDVYEVVDKALLATEKV